MFQSILDKEATTSDLEIGKIYKQIPPAMFKPNPWIYYSDFTLFVLLGNGCLFFAALQQPFSALQIALACVAIISIYRASFFVHELMHIGKKVRGFNLYYNVMHGFVHKLPSYAFVSHLQHHKLEHYGQIHDSEYDRFGGKSKLFFTIGMPLFTAMLLPIIAVLRWVVVPLFLPFIGRKGRQFIYQKATILGFHTRGSLPAPTAKERRNWYIQDAWCAFYGVGMLALIYFQLWPWELLPLWYAVFGIANAMNMYRGTIVHRYFGDFSTMNRKQMVLDCITLPTNKFNVWLFPLGMGYHALHHMFPQVPYHHLDALHAQLMNDLPDNHPYRATLIKNYREGLEVLSRGSF